MTSLRVVAVILLLSTVGLQGCATRPKTLYQWESYQSNVDNYFRGDTLSPDAQAQLAEADLLKIRAAGGIVPPGYKAHLGLLYAKQGRLDQFAEQMKAEKEQYPESETFVDFLLRNFK